MPATLDKKAIAEFKKLCAMEDALEQRIRDWNKSVLDPMLAEAKSVLDVVAIHKELAGLTWGPLGEPRQIPGTISVRLALEHGRFEADS